MLKKSCVVLLMAIGLLLVQPSWAEDVNAVVLEDFEGDPNLPAWTIDTGAESLAIVADPLDPNNNVLKLGPGASTVMYLPWSVAPDANATLSFSLLSDAIDPNNLINNTVIGAADGAGFNWPNYLGYVRMAKAGIDYRDGKSFVNAVPTIEPMTWYDVLISFNSAARTFDLYIEGVLIAQGAGFRSSDLGGIQKVLIRQWTPDENLGYIDNIIAGAPVPAQNALVHQWKLDEEAVADGSEIADSAGDVNGVVVGAGVMTDLGVYGNALRFDGTSHVDVNGIVTDDLKNISVALWINPDVNAMGENDNGKIKRVFSGGDHFEVVLQGGSGQVANNFYQKGGTYPKSTDSLVAGEWNHVAVTSELMPEGSGLMTIYVNGALDVTMEATADDDWNDGVMRMGHRPGRPDDERFIGALDDIRIYQGVISPFKVQMILAGK